MNQVSHINVANDVGAVNGLRKVAQQDKTEALKAVAKQFEAIMMQQLLKSSRETSWDDGFGEDVPGVGSMDTYREWRDDQLAQTLSTKGTMGFADMLVKQLAPALNNNAKMGIASDLVDEQGATQPAQPLSRTHSSGNNVSGWWKVPAADIPELPKSTNEVGLPTTEESLLLRNLLQGKITTQPKQS